MKGNLQPVGQYSQQFNDLTGQSLPCGTVYQSPGLRTHILKHHPSRLNDMPLISSIIQSPDYIGHNPSHPDSIELVKVFQDNLMLCIKLDQQNQRLYVATFFEITTSKLQSRLNTGRLVPFK